MNEIATIVNSPPHDAGLSSYPPNVQMPVNPLLRLHQLLNGRYHWAIALGTVLALMAGIAAYTKVQPTYQSVGYIQIKPAVSRILYTNEQNSIMPMFDAFVQTQASMLSSQRAIMLAMQSPDWQAAVAKSKPHTLADFTDSLNVTHASNTELIEVIFTDKDRDLAPVAVKAIIEAYQRINEESVVDSSTQQMRTLNDLRDNLSNQLKNKNDKILEIGTEFGTDDLEPIYQSHLTEANQIRASMDEAQLAVTYATPSATSQPATANAATPDAITPESVANQDPVIQELLTEERNEAEQVSSLTTHFGSSHPAVLRAAAAKQATEDAIAARMRNYQSATTQPSGGADGRAISGPGTPSLQQLSRRLGDLKGLYDHANAELLDIGRKELDIKRLKSDLPEIQQNLDAVKARIDQLNVESTVSGRISVLSTGDTPLRPIKNRKLPVTLAATFFAFSFGVGIIALLGASDRRLKSVSEAHSFLDRSNRILGVLPALPDDLADPEQASRAAYCVHHIRTLLQIGSGAASHATYAITSSSPGEGKTSLAHSLGLSYAATGMKTLLIDFDLVGAGLTARVNAIIRRRIGDILVGEKLITREQLDSSLAIAQQSGMRLGETLVAQGFLTKGALDTALITQKESRLGLLDILDGERFENCVTSAGSPNLFILPMGNMSLKHGTQLSLRSVRDVLDSARSQFDVILVDTGPILGSLEACIVTAVVDEVIVVVAKGQERPLINKTFAKLTEVGGRIAGIVFNRANDEDVQRSGYSSSYSSQSVGSQGIASITAGNGSRQLGPVARAVYAVGKAESFEDTSGNPK